MHIIFEAEQLITIYSNDLVPTSHPTRHLTKCVTRQQNVIHTRNYSVVKVEPTTFQLVTMFLGRVFQQISVLHSAQV